jgi:hypothetical protein
MFELELSTRNINGDFRKICVGDVENHELLVWTDRAATLTVNLFTERLSQYLGGAHFDTEWRKAGFTKDIKGFDNTIIIVETKEFGKGFESGKDWASVASMLITIANSRDIYE